MMLQTEHTYSIRPFLPTEVEQYKAMRLEALQLEPGMFGNSYVFESSLPDADWLNRIVNPLRACFSLFCDDELIGITAIVTEKESPEKVI